MDPRVRPEGLLLIEIFVIHRKPSRPSGLAEGPFPPPYYVTIPISDNIAHSTDSAI
jgi:hypothetical protein